MFIDDKIYQAYLEELQQLESFRASHIELYGETPFETEDPHTKRLMETLAFLGARARLQGVKRITHIHQRLFRQYFPYLVNSLPAFGLLQIKPSIRFPEKIMLPTGSELMIKTTDQLKAFFQTLESTTVFPIFLKRCQFERKEGYGWRFVMEYGSHHVSTEEIGSFKLFINHLNSFFSSLRVSFAMQRSLEKVIVFYDQSQSGEGFDCNVSFGFDSQERVIFNHEIEQIRSLLHFPQQELFVTLNIPPSGERWQTMRIEFHFNEEWPESIKLNEESLIPFIVPIVNLKKGYAEPIVCNGMKDQYSILHPDPIHKFELHTVLQVSEILSSGTRPLKPGILGPGTPTYEIDYFNQQLLLEMPSAFAEPKTVTTLGLWSQPWFSDYVNDDIELQFNEAQMFGLETRLLGSLHRSEKMVTDDPNYLIRILSLKNQNYLSLNEILFILGAMKQLNQSFFDDVPDSIRDVKIHQKMNQRNFSSVVEYEFFLRDWGGQKWEVGVLFFSYLHRMLNSWLPNFEIELTVHFPKSKQPLVITQGKKHELSALARNFFLSQ